MYTILSWLSICQTSLLEDVTLSRAQKPLQESSRCHSDCVNFSDGPCKSSWQFNPEENEFLVLEVLKNALTTTVSAFLSFPFLSFLLAFPSLFPLFPPCLFQLTQILWYSRYFFSFLNLGCVFWTTIFLCKTYCVDHAGLRDLLPLPAECWD